MKTKHSIRFLYYFIVIFYKSYVDCDKSKKNEDVKNLEKRQIPRLDNKVYKECTTSSGIKGLCVPNTFCKMSELRGDFWKTLSYLCIIENEHIGVCCQKQMISRDGPNFVDNTRNSDEIDPNRAETRGCGLTTKMFPRIAGGRPAESDEWPWIAAIIRRGFPNVYCGGALISDKHILTAAHCTDKYGKELFVRLGEYDFSEINETRSRDFRISDIKNHIDYDSSTYENDIAIVVIDRATIFNTYIWPVCMPPLSETWEGWTGVVIGWGTKFFGGPHSKVLMEVSVPIWSQQKCQDAFVYRVGDNILCAGLDEGGRDSCQGDSGGPLLVQLPNKRWVVAGIVSWGLRCGEPGRPGLYTMVNRYTQWIIENTTN